MRHATNPDHMTTADLWHWHVLYASFARDARAGGADAQADYYAVLQYEIDIALARRQCHA